MQRLSSTSQMRRVIWSDIDIHRCHTARSDTPQFFPRPENESISVYMRVQLSGKCTLDALERWGWGISASLREHAKYTVAIMSHRFRWSFYSCVYR